MLFLKPETQEEADELNENAIDNAHEINHLVRIFYNPFSEVELPPLPSPPPCGNLSLVATNLTLEELIALRWLLTFVFRVTWWPFPIRREVFQSLRIKLFGAWVPGD